MRNYDNSGYGDSGYRGYMQSFQGLVSSLRELATEVPIIAGGAGFTLYAQTIMQNTPALDYGVFSEGEATLRKNPII